MSIIRRGSELLSPGNLREEVNRLFDDFLTPMAGRERPLTFTPAVDVSESASAVTVRAELPGLDPSDIDVNITGNVLTLRGEKREEKEEKNKSWYRLERSYGSFARSIPLPEGVDPEKVNATFDKGILNIEIAKTESARPRSIKISTPHK